MTTSKKLYGFAVTLTALLTFSSSSVSMAAGTASGTAKVTVISGLNLTNSRDLNFGTVVIGNSATGVVAATDNANSAEFQVAGQASTSYNIVLPSAGTVMKKGAGGSADTEIAVGTFTTNKAGEASVLNASGSDVFQVGGTRASLVASQQAGLYSGTFQVSVVY